MSSDERREFYRIVYQRLDQPTFRVAEQSFRVRDCSERGVRFLVEEPAAAFTAGAAVQGVIRFRQGDTAAVEGVVVRANSEMVALRLEGAGIPFALILSEQRRLYARDWALSR